MAGLLAVLQRWFWQVFGEPLGVAKRIYPQISTDYGVAIVSICA
jgi:hypothetical protein